MPITKDRVKTNEIVDLTFEPFTTDDSSPSPKGLLDQLKSAAGDLSSAMDAVSGLSKMDLNLSNPLKGLVDSLGLGGLKSFLDRNPFNDLLSLFDYILCMPKMNLNLRLGLHLNNLFKNLAFGFDLKLCGEVINGNPLDAVLNKIKTFDPIDIQLSIETDEWIANNLNRIMKQNAASLNLPPALSKILNIYAGDSMSGSIASLGLTLGYKNPMVNPKWRPIDGPDGSRISLGKTSINDGGPGGDKSEYRAKYDYMNYLKRLFYGAAADTLSKEENRKFMERFMMQNLAMSDALSTKIFLQGFSDSLTSNRGNNTAYKLNCLADFLEKKNDGKAIDENAVYNFGKVNMIIKKLDGEGGSKEEWKVTYDFRKMYKALGIVVPNWVLDTNGQVNYYRAVGNKFLKRLSEEEMRRIEPNRERIPRDPDDPLLFTRILSMKEEVA